LGRQISRLRASALRTSGKDSGSMPTILDVIEQKGWNTPRATDGTNGGPNQAGGALPSDAALTGWPTPTTRDHKDGGNPNVDVPVNALLGRTAWLAGWPTPMAGTPAQNGNNPAGNTDSSRKTVALAGWPTPQASKNTKNSKDPQRMKEGGVQTSLADAAWLTQAPQPARLTARGEMLTGCSAGMESGGPLSPAMSAWLMGIPAIWDEVAVQIPPLKRKRKK